MDTTRPADVDAALGHTVTNGVAACALGAAGLGFLRFASSLLKLKRGLRGRRLVDDPRLLERLHRIRVRTRLRRVLLTQAADLASPLVIGANEVCIPAALFESLGDAEVDNVFAHELAHLERGDGFWFPAAGLVQSVLWLHPLNHWISSCFRRSAELACDDRAVALTGDPLALARALVHVAAATSASRGTIAPTMAESASALLTRVSRLTRPGSRAAFGARDGGRLAVAAPMVMGLALTASSFRPLQARGVAGEAFSAMAIMPEQPMPAKTPPDAATPSTRIAELERCARDLEEELATARRLPESEQAGTPDAVRVLELGQELANLRATESWLEQRFVDDWASWQKQTSSERTAR
jgi:hypothetical protein